MAEMGRPRKYEENWPEKVMTYINDCKKNDSLPLIEELALDVLECSDDTIYRYVNKKDDKGELVYPDFCGAIRRLQMLQKKMLMIKGLDSTYNSHITKFILMNNHDMKDKSDMTSDGRTVREPIEIYMVKPDGVPEEYE